jgi:hypothetical protein
MIVAPAKLQEIADRVVAAMRVRHRPVEVKWDLQKLPLAFMGRQIPYDVVLKETHHEHNGDQVAFSVIFATKPSCDWRGALEFYVFEKDLQHVTGWIADMAVMDEYRKLHTYLNNLLYAGRKIAILTSVIEVKLQRKNR